MCFLASLRKLPSGPQDPQPTIFESHSSYKLTVNYLPNIKQQADTVGNYLVNIPEHLAAKEPHHLKEVVETKN